MTDFDAQRDMPAGADEVFAVVSDLGRLTEWLPHAVAVRPRGGVAAETADRANPTSHETPVHAAVDPPIVGHPGVDGHGDVRVLTDQMRMEWGASGSGEYTGWLQVTADEAQRSSVALHLTIGADEPGDPDQVRVGLDDALARLEQLVATAR